MAVIVMTYRGRRRRRGHVVSSSLDAIPAGLDAPELIEPDVSLRFQSEEVEVAFQAALKRALQEDAEDTLTDPDSKYPAPILLGATAYRDCAIWSADWRKRLPLGHPDRPSDPAEFVGHDDPDYLKTLDLMVEMGIPSVKAATD